MTININADNCPNFASDFLSWLAEQDVHVTVRTKLGTVVKGIPDMFLENEDPGAEFDGQLMFGDAGKGLVFSKDIESISIS